MRNYFSKVKKNISKTLSILLSVLLIFQFVLPIQVLATTNTWDFSTAGDYTYDNTKIEFSSGQAQLKATTTPAWYNASWTKRKAITIDNTNNSSSLTDYQVQIVVTYDSDMLANFNDIRFTDTDGTTLLNNWLETETDSTSATFWVKVPSITASSNYTIYMYYGNSGASSASSGSNTFAYFDNLDSLTGYSTFGTGSWSIASDATRGNVAAVSADSNDSGIYESTSLPSSYVTQVYVKDSLDESPASAGQWGGPLMDMEDSDSWYRPGFNQGAGIQVRDDNNGSFTNYSQNSTANTSVNTWYKTEAIFKNATQLSSSANFTPIAGSLLQGLATDGTYIYTSGNYILAKYDRSGNLITSITRPSDNNHFGGMQIVGSKLYAIIFNYQSGPTSETHIYSWNLDLTGETEIADITASVGNGGNALAYNNGYWIVGETGGNTSNFNQHFYIFDTNWNLIKTIQSPYYNDAGHQDATFNGNSLYVTEHDGTILVFTWDPSALDLRLSDTITPSATYNEGIAYDSTNNVFYIQNTATSKIHTVTFPELATKRIAYYISHSSESHGVVYHDFTPRTQNYFGVAAYRNAYFSQLLVRKYSFPEPVISSFGSESVEYDANNPTIQPTSATTFTSLSSFIETSTLNGGTIKYQISNDNGTVWYWYNSGWTTTSAGYTEANTASDINTNIATFPTGSGQFLFKAYLHSNGSQLVQLDSVDIAGVPLAPTIGTPTVLSSSSIRWNFTDNSDDETGFRIYDNTDTLATSSATADLSYLDETGLSENTQYSGRYATAYNSSGNSASSSAATAKYTLADTPTNLSASSNSNSVSLSVDSLTNDTSGQSGYYFSRSGGGNSDWIQTNSWTETGLSCGHEYTYSVKYRNGDGTETSEISTTKSTSGCGGGGLPPAAYNYPNPPLGGFNVLINNGVTQANNRNVTLNFNAGSDVKKMAISLTGDFNDANQEDYSPIKQIDLCSKFGGLIKNSTCPDGQYTIYVKFYTQYGRASDVVSTKINLVTTPQFSAPAMTFTKNLYLGSKDGQVKALQQFLNQNGYRLADSSWGSPGNETDYFGTLTSNALSKFQEANKDKVTGMINEKGLLGPITRQFINSSANTTTPATPMQQTQISAIFTTPLYRGLQSEDVRRLQTLLATKPEIYPEGLITGYFGPLTEKAVRTFQLNYGVVESSSDPGFGYVGPKTRVKLQEVFGK